MEQWLWCLPVMGVLVGVGLLSFWLGRRTGERKRRSEQATYAFALTGALVTLRHQFEEARYEDCGVMLRTLRRALYHLWLENQGYLTGEQRASLQETATSKAVNEAAQEFSGSASGGHGAEQ